VAEKLEFAGRRKNVTLNNGDKLPFGWYVNDFTLAEIKSLTVKQRVAIRDQYYNGFFTVPTFAELLELIANKSKELNVTIGVYPELKHPTYFAQNGLYFDNIVFETLLQFGYKLNGDAAKDELIVLECFESTTLRRLRGLTDIRTAQLIDAPDRLQEDTVQRYELMLTAGGLDEIQKYANGIGPLKFILYEFDTE